MKTRLLEFVLGLFLIGAFVVPQVVSAAGINFNALTPNPGSLSGTDTTADDNGTHTYSITYSNILTWIESGANTWAGVNTFKGAYGIQQSDGTLKWAIDVGTVAGTWRVCILNGGGTCGGAGLVLTGNDSLANITTACLQSNGGSWCVENDGSLEHNGSAFTPPTILRAATGSTLGGSALTAGQCSDETVSMSGVGGGMVATASPNGDPGAGFTWMAIAESNQVDVRICAIVSGTPTARFYQVAVIE